MMIFAADKNPISGGNFLIDSLNIEFSHYGTLDIIYSYIGIQPGI